MRRGSCALCCALVATPAAADDYPSRPVRDHRLARRRRPERHLHARARRRDGASARRQPSVVIENRPGAGGIVGARACADAQPDGYTICILNGRGDGSSIRSSTRTAARSGEEPHAGHQGVPPDAGVRGERLARRQEFQRAGGAGQGQAQDAELHGALAARRSPSWRTLNKKNGTDFVRVPFKGGGDAVNSMLTGTTPIAIFGIGNLIQFMRNGKLIGFAVDGDNRSPLGPTSRRSRRPATTSTWCASFFGIYAPAGTPAADHRQDQQGDRRRSRPKPEFQKRNMVPAISPGAAIAGAVAKASSGRAECLEAVKASGLYPDMKCFRAADADCARRARPDSSPV